MAVALDVWGVGSRFLGGTAWRVRETYPKAPVLSMGFAREKP